MREKTAFLYHSESLLSSQLPQLKLDRANPSKSGRDEVNKEMIWINTRIRSIGLSNLQMRNTLTITEYGTHEAGQLKADNKSEQLHADN